MYSAPEGHGPASVKARALKLVRLGSLSKESYDIAVRPDVYKAYATDLFEILKKKSHKAPILNEDELSKLLDSFCSIKNDSSFQIEFIRRNATPPIRSSYAPEKEDALPWETFHRKKMISARLLMEAVKIAKA